MGLKSLATFEFEICIFLLLLKHPILPAKLPIDGRLFANLRDLWNDGFSSFLPTVEVKTFWCDRALHGDITRGLLNSSIEFLRRMDELN